MCLKLLVWICGFLFVAEGVTEKTCRLDDEHEVAEPKECCKEESCCQDGKGPCHDDKKGSACQQTKPCGCKGGEDCKCSEGKCGC